MCECVADPILFRDPQIRTFQGQFGFGSGFGPVLFFQNKMIGNAVCGFIIGKMCKNDLLGRVCPGKERTHSINYKQLIETNRMVSFFEMHEF